MPVTPSVSVRTPCEHGAQTRCKSRILARLHFETRGHARARPGRAGSTTESADSTRGVGVALAVAQRRRGRLLLEAPLFGELLSVGGNDFSRRDRARRGIRPALHPEPVG